MAKSEPHFTEDHYPGTRSSTWDHRGHQSVHCHRAGGAEAGQSSAQSSAGPAADQANLWWSAMQQQFGQMMTAAQAGAQSMMETKPQGPKRPGGTKKTEA